MADYDAGELTDRESLAGENQTAISSQNVRDVQNQLARQLANYDFADAQNRALANLQLRQNARKSNADRFEAQRDLQAATLGLLGSMGNAMNGSSTGNLMSMLRNRNDKENSTYWEQHLTNQNAVENAYQDSLNQNLVARRDAMQSAEKAIRDIEGDWRANMNNINPNLFPGGSGAIGGSEELKSGSAWQPGNAPQNNAEISGYRVTSRIPSDSPTGTTYAGTTPSRTSSTGNDYFSQLMNRFSGR